MRPPKSRALPSSFASELVTRLNEQFKNFDLRRYMAVREHLDRERDLRRVHDKVSKKELAKATTKDPDDLERQRLINSMSNWQRNQWARSGYSKKLKDLRRFAEMKKAA